MTNLADKMEEMANKKEQEYNLLKQPYDQSKVHAIYSERDLFSKGILALQAFQRIGWLYQRIDELEKENKELVLKVGNLQK